ncbi:hypothetical protein EIN_397910 [Entamoeba invadens IP1]|uniref:Uncharacterized protein n=1 Tax=Entamoeba invadens IP1 TaxID=370355 RepID=A0A0A1UDI1_ENTIV|nr:hypothetical protein EIN_397910 [Entamoeba invadens IP1]ELP91871.1 hypothetical protein EIN_397910 [Entamoeba invadens IP1]|eukprot:XP_004258642.1 hypothetical protein EIN_397910 [Entamoeba invadens IP1]
MGRVARQKKLKTIDPFCPQKRKDTVQKIQEERHKGRVKQHDLPYKEEDEYKIPLMWRLTQLAMQNDGKSKAQIKRENEKHEKEYQERRKKEREEFNGKKSKKDKALALIEDIGSSKKQQNFKKLKIDAQIRKEDAELKSLLKEKERLEKMLQK